MKENEYRAWDELNKTMSYWTMNDLCAWGEDKEKPNPFDKWMQYTGLKDKNGVEIYEGDIIRQHFGKESEIVGNVIFSGFQYMCTQVVAGKDKTNYFGYNSEDIELDRLEVIGNIYKNPGLLKLGDK